PRSTLFPYTTLFRSKVVWETNVTSDQPLLQITSAVLPIKDKIIVGAAGGDRGVRDWIAALDAKTGKQVWNQYIIPKPGEPGSERSEEHTSELQSRFD